MPVLTRRFEKIRNILNSRMTDLTVVLEDIEKPHNISAIIRSCDAVGVLEAHSIGKEGKSLQTFNSTAQGSQKWVKIKSHKTINSAIKELKIKGFKIYGTVLGDKSCDYRDCDFTGPTAFVLGAEKWGLNKETIALMDQSIFIPMRGMVQSLNVSVATAILLFEALRQREKLGLVPTDGEGIEEKVYKDTIFEWTYPDVAKWCKKKGIDYPSINNKGEIIDNLPRTEKLRC